MNGTTKAPSRDAQLMMVTDKNPNPHAENNCIINILNLTIKDKTINIPDHSGFIGSFEEPRVILNQ